MKNYQLIGFPNVEMSHYIAQFEQSFTFDPARALSEVSYGHSSYVVSHHMQLLEVSNWMEHARSCCDLVGAYFATIEKQGCWFSALFNALLCGSYAGLWNELESLADLDFYKFEEDYLGTDPDELQYIVLRVLYSLNPDRPPPSERSERRLSQLTNKKAKRFWDLWKRVEAENQEEFSVNLIDSVARFARRKKPPADATFPLEWIAHFESIVASFALHKGLKLPEFAPKQKALLMLSDRCTS